MSWIESHQKLERDPKLIHLANVMGWSIYDTIGRLHCYWWWCVDHCEDGDLSRWNDAVIASGAGVAAPDAGRFVEAMVAGCGIGDSFIEREPYFRLRNWWKFTGRFWQVKYKLHPQKWRRIKDLYIGGYNNSCNKGDDNHIPNLNIPNLTTSLSQEHALALSQLLADLILRNNPKNRTLMESKREKTINDWALEIDKLYKIDKQSPEDIRAVIKWCQNDNFWKMNILSGKKLREKWDQLFARMGNGGYQGSVAAARPKQNIADILKNEEEKIKAEGKW